ncbi:MAG: ATP-binding protein, partial [Acidimicrobiales bacterium]
MTGSSPHVVQRLAPVGGPLVGRTEEMDALRRAWAGAVAGHGGMVLLGGEAGVGKSRLAAELAGEVEADGGSVLFGGCPDGGAEPFHPLVEALGPLPPGHARGRVGVFNELAGAIAARAERSPALLVLDDLHRTDRSTVLALRAVVEAATEARVLVVGTFREAAVDRAHPLVELLACPAVRRISVEGLTEDDVADLVGDAELARSLWRGSAGNPVAIAELLRPGALDGRRYTFDELVAHRVAGLRQPARAFLEAAAVAGSAFHVEVVARAAGIRTERADAALKQVAGAGFVVEEPAGPGASRRFVHDMVRESVVRGLEPGPRVDLHLRIGRALGADPSRTGAPVALLAWHYRSAAPVGGSPPALGYSAQAGERAMELLAWEEAAVHFGHALAASAGATPQVRADLLLALGEAQRLAGEKARARQAILEAATLAEACHDGARLARAALALGHVGEVWGTDAELERLADEARAMLGEQVPQSLGATAQFTDFASPALYDVLDGVQHDEAPDPPAPAAEAVVHPGRVGGDVFQRAPN